MTVSENSIRTELSRTAYTKIALRIVPLVFFCYLASYLDRVNVGFAQLQMSTELHFGNAVFGLGSGLFFVSYIIFEVPSNLLLERVGARVWIARIMITWALMSALTMFVTNPGEYYVMRFLLGVAEAGFVPGVLVYLAEWFPGRIRARAIGVFMMGIPVATMLGGPLSGWIMTSLDRSAGWSGWQWLFLLEAVPTAVLGILVFALLPNQVSTARWLTGQEKESVRHDLAHDDAGVNRRHDILGALRHPRVWWLGVVDMSFMVGTYAIAFWLPTMLREAKVTDIQTIGWLTAVPSAVALVAMLATSVASDRFRERRWHLMIPMLIGAAGLAGSAWAHGSAALTVLMFTIADVGIVSCYPVFWCLPATFLRGRAAATGIALVASMSNFGGFIATYLLSWLRDLTHSPALGLLLFAGFLAASTFLVFRLPANEVNR
jgi:MFS family permease